MQKIKDFCKRHRLLWLTLLVALAAAAVAAWAGFDLGQRVDNQPVYEIVNDDYTRTVVIPATADAATQDDGTTGLYLPVPLKSGQRIYGVRLDLTTHNWAFRQGTLYAALLDADGNAVANGELDCITIKDDTFAAITFDAPYTAPGTADAEADYDLANPNMTLRLWHTPGDDWDVYHLLGLWTDADTSQQMTRRNANGTTDSIVGHPALQYVVNDSGSWSHVISRLLGVLTFAAVVAGFILLTHRAKLWQVVLVCGAVLGGGAQIKRLNADKQRQHQHRIPAGQAVPQGIHGIHHHAGRYQIEHPPAGAENAAQLQQLCRQRQLNAGVAPVNFVADGKQR